MSKIKSFFALAKEERENAVNRTSSHVDRIYKDLCSDMQEIVLNLYTESSNKIEIRYRCFDSYGKLSKTLYKEHYAFNRADSIKIAAILQTELNKLDESENFIEVVPGTNYLDIIVSLG